MLDVRLRRMMSADGGEFRREETTAALDTAKTAVVVVDMWDRHWCVRYTERVGELVPPMNECLDAVRGLGIQVVFAPSDVVDFYEDFPQRRATLALPSHALPEPRSFDPPPPPVRGGCECGPDRPCKSHKAWTRQHPGLRIEDRDLIVDCNNTQDLWNICCGRGVDTLLYMGVATNMCVIGRACGILPMTRLGLRCILVRDLARAISGNGFNPDRDAKDPSFTPELGDELVLRHLEQHVCPSIDSAQLM